MFARKKFARKKFARKKSAGCIGTDSSLDEYTSQELASVLPGALTPGLSLVLKPRRLGVLGCLAFQLIPQRLRVVRIVLIVGRDRGGLRFSHGFDGNEFPT